MPAKPVIEVLRESGMSELGEALSFSISNTGDSTAEFGFDLSGVYAELPPGSSLSFEFTGARYEGRLYLRFPAATGASDELPVLNKVSIIKITHHC